MVNISVKGEYALNAIFDLAAHANGKPVKIADIASRQRIPQKFLELILASLKQGGFVASRRGADGGYMLARPAESITVGEVWRFVESGRGLREPSRNQEENAFADIWRRVDTAVSLVVDRTSFAEVVRLRKEAKNSYVPNWDI